MVSGVCIHARPNGKTRFTTLSNQSISIWQDLRWRKNFLGFVIFVKHTAHCSQFQISLVEHLPTNGMYTREKKSTTKPGSNLPPEHSILLFSIFLFTQEQFDTLKAVTSDCWTRTDDSTKRENLFRGSRGASWMELRSRNLYSKRHSYSYRMLWETFALHMCMCHLVLALVLCLHWHLICECTQLDEIQYTFVGTRAN